jgi:hypothetical protein
LVLVLLVVLGVEVLEQAQQVLRAAQALLGKEMRVEQVIQMVVVITLQPEAAVQELLA